MSINRIVWYKRMMDDEELSSAPICSPLSFSIGVTGFRAKKSFRRFRLWLIHSFDRVELLASKEGDTPLLPRVFFVPEIHVACFYVVLLATSILPNSSQSLESIENFQAIIAQSRRPLDMAPKDT
jgi:hypothetical protein